ncbi:hypothetical protein SODG_005844 [Sodalis praecaptivus]
MHLQLHGLGGVALHPDTVDAVTFGRQEPDMIGIDIQPFTVDGDAFKAEALTL